MKNNDRNAGRKKKTNEAYTVRCHPKVIKDVRKYAKEKSEEYVKNTTTAINRSSETTGSS